MTCRDFCLYFYSLWRMKEEKFPHKGTVKLFKCYNEEDHVRTSNVPILLSGNIVDMHALGSKLTASHNFIKIWN